jgi:beta-lactamase regulating signal transducer with metallopeptidase domain
VAESGSLLLGFVLTLLLHASVLLGAVWLGERVGLLRHAAHAELAWRAALFGALLTASVGFLAPRWFSAPEETRAALAVPPPALAPAAPSQVANASIPGARARSADQRPEAGPVPVISRIEHSSARRAPRAEVTALQMPDFIVGALALAWLAASMAMLLLVAWRGLAVHRLQRAARRWPDATPTELRAAASLASQFGLRAPVLRRGSQLDSPVAMPDGSVLLPDWSVALPPDQSQALIAHEFAHQQRRDPQWRIAQQLALAPLSLHPLAWFALRRLDALAERRADALAARVLGDGRPLAECLAVCLAQQQSNPVRAPRLALAMAERPGAVVDRVQHLLEDDPMNDATPSPRRTRLAIALGLLACLSLPSIAVVAFADGLGLGQSISIQTDADGNESVDMSIARSGYRLDVEMDGKIVFAPDESDVSALGAGAQLEITETLDGVKRSIAFERQGDGVARDYRVDGDTHPFDADARLWLARLLPEIFRSAGIDAEARAQRILARGGTDALLGEIDLIRSDYGRGRYIGLLYTHAKLDATQQTRALDLMRAIGSDHELRQAMTQALASTTLDRAQQLQVLDIALDIGSDYERAELLIDVAARFAFDDASFERWAAALDDVGSDYERRRVLEALLAHAGEHPGAVQLAFEAAAGLGSDYEKRQLLEAGLTHARDAAALRAQYLAVAATIGSGHERKEAIIALLRVGAVDVPLALAALDAIAGIGSDHDCKEALLVLAQVMPTDAAVIDAYRKVARQLSTFERGQVEQALDQRVAVL